MTRERMSLLFQPSRNSGQATKPTVQQYTRIEEFTVLQQIQNWTTHDDKALSDLARRFLARKRLAMVDPPPARDDLAVNYDAWEKRCSNS